MSIRIARARRGSSLEVLSMLALLTCATLPCGARAGDVFNMNSSVPASPASPLLDGPPAEACKSRPLASPLPLLEAVERALCDSPKTRSAWESVKVATAAVGIAKSAYLPTLGADAAYSAEVNSTAATHDPELRDSYSQGVYTASLSMSWLLFDFGARAAALRNSRALLAAAQATRNATLQAAFLNVARDYYAAQAALAMLVSTRRIEAATAQVLTAASTRYKTGVAPITDQLQAGTAYAQAVYERTMAEGSLRLQQGTLAVDMNLAPDTPVTLPELDTAVLPDAGFADAVHDLIDAATREHPTVLAARAEWQAALDEVDLAKSSGLPKIQLDGAVSASNGPVAASLGQPEFPATTREHSIGLSVSIPLFAGFSRGYRIRQAQALTHIAELGLHDTEQQVALNVWSSYAALQTDTENLRNADTILQSARQAFEAAQQRYQRGVGNILEMLSIENTLAAAEQLQIQSRAQWRTGRLALAASLGTLGVSAIQ